MLSKFAQSGLTKLNYAQRLALFIQIYLIMDKFEMLPHPGGLADPLLKEAQGYYLRALLSSHRKYTCQ